MENPEEILQTLEEFSKIKPKEIPRELEDYLCFVAKTGDPVYQWSVIKYLFREKLVKVMTDFYETCPSVEIPPCPNVEAFNYDSMKTFILDRLETFVAAPFTVQRICELLTAPRKQYNRIDKYMRALEKNILVVSTKEPGAQKRSTENGENILNGLENDTHMSGHDSLNTDVHIEVDMDVSPVWTKTNVTDTSMYEISKPDFTEIQNAANNDDSVKPIDTIHFENTQDVELNNDINTNSNNECLTSNSSSSDSESDTTSLTDSLPESPVLNKENDVKSVDNYEMSTVTNNIEDTVVTMEVDPLKVTQNSHTSIEDAVQEPETDYNVKKILEQDDLKIDNVVATELNDVSVDTVECKSPRQNDVEAGMKTSDNDCLESDNVDLKNDDDDINASNGLVESSDSSKDDFDKVEEESAQPLTETSIKSVNQLENEEETVEEIKDDQVSSIEVPLETECSVLPEPQPESDVTSTKDDDDSISTELTTQSESDKCKESTCEPNVSDVEQVFKNDETEDEPKSINEVTNSESITESTESEIEETKCLNEDN